MGLLAKKSVARHLSQFDTPIASSSPGVFSTLLSEDIKALHEMLLQQALHPSAQIAGLTSYSKPSTATMWRSEVPIVYFLASEYSGEL